MEFQKRYHRREMHIDAQKTHLGEARWTNVGADGIEFISSHNAVVGWFVGYSLVQKKSSKTVTKSRGLQCEWGMRWAMVPPLCRPDNIEVKKHGGSAAAAGKELAGRARRRAVSDRELELAGRGVR